MLNFRILAAWPNYFIVPAMLSFWVIFGVLVTHLLKSSPSSAAPAAQQTKA